MSRYCDPNPYRIVSLEYKTPCWIWQKYTLGGYGRLRRKGRLMYAHRYYYEQTKGKIPEGLTIHHLCNNSACVNVEHMELVTLEENSRRGGRDGNNGGWLKKVAI